jgi:hypothetical protein
MNEVIVYVGKKVTDGALDVWEKTTLSNLAQKIIAPEDSLKAGIQGLRRLKTIDIRKYALQKRNLPYFICATFQDNRRVLANFQAIDALVIDFDHLPESALDPAEVRNLVGKDSRVSLAFISPGGDGVKIIVKLQTPVRDPEIYSRLYKAFVTDFARHHQIHCHPDMVTHDVTRICFLSFDLDCIFNPEATAIAPEQWVNLYPSSEDLFHESVVSDTEPNPLPVSIPSANLTPVVKPGSDQLRAILFPEKKIIQTNPNEDIPQLNLLVHMLQDKLGEYGLQLVEATNIQYGKKIRVQYGLKFGEVNVFSIVKSPKHGTDKEVMEALYNLINSLVQ